MIRFAFLPWLAYCAFRSFGSRLVGKGGWYVRRFGIGGRFGL